MAKECNVQVWSCKHCGTLAVAINAYRVTNHKCAGAWKVVLAEDVAVAQVKEGMRHAP